ncbi:MAG TPA: PepSY domain-containing protein [Nitrososphaeraceae archaeon]|nr:PepSY domain-containing protein [Nitrososphaeraceae archaeon]
MTKVFNKQPLLVMLASALFVSSFYFAYNQFSLDVSGQELKKETLEIETNKNTTIDNPNSNWTGSVDISKVIRESFDPLIKISLSEAITNAETNIGNDTSAVAAFIHPVKGYLVYVIYLLNNQNEVTKVITDVGTGEILKTKKMTIEEMMLKFHRGGMTKSQGEYTGGQNYMMEKMMDKSHY